MGRENSLKQRQDLGALEQVQLGGIFLEYPGEGELLHGAPSVIGRVQCDLRGSLILFWFFDQEESFSIGRTTRWRRSQA